MMVVVVMIIVIVMIVLTVIMVMTKTMIIVPNLSDYAQQPVQVLGKTSNLLLQGLV